MAISRDSRHKRRKTGGRRKVHVKKRHFEQGRPPAMTKLGEPSVRPVRVCGGNYKFRALRLHDGAYSWGSIGKAVRARILEVVYNATNNELVRTKTLVKGTIVEVDATPFRALFEAFYHYRIPVKDKDAGGPIVEEGKEVSDKIKARQEVAKKLLADARFAEQFTNGRLLACISSRPGQVGRADGYILEAKELEFYKKQIDARKKK